MTLAAALCWLGVGLWLLADSARIRWLAPLVRTGARVRALRVSGGALVLSAAIPLAQSLGAPRAAAALVVLVTAVLSLAVLAYPLRPRWYAASLPLALAVAIAASLRG